MEYKFEICVEQEFIDASVLSLLQAHKEHCEAETPIGSCHRLDVDAMRAPKLVTWVAWLEDVALGIIAIKEINPTHCEVKSMHVRENMRGTSIASDLFIILLTHARANGYERLNLETGAQPNFLAAIRFYEKHGFERCGSFGDYRDDPNSVFMSLTL